jgi:hypothetical protein
MLEPGNHRGPGSQRLPASAETAGAFRAGRIDDVVADFRMSTVDSTIELSVENDAAANSCTDCHVDEACTIAACSPSGFGEGSSVAIVFERDLHAEDLRKISDGTLAAPAGKKIDVAELSAHRIHRTRRPDPNASNLRASSLRRLAQHVRDEFDAIGVTIRVGGRFHPRKDLARIIHHANCDFGTADIDGSDHEYSGAIDLASSSVRRFLFL